MASFFNLILDTTAPSSPTIVIAGGATFSSDQTVSVSFGTTDTVTTGYQMKIWGNVDETYDVGIKATEATSTWIAYSATKMVKLLTGDGNKTLSVKIRDDVYNESAIVTDSISLNTALPIVTVGTPDVTKLSKVVGKNTSSISISSTATFVEYKVKVVTTTNATHETGTLIPVTNGSTNTNAIGIFTTPITVTIKGADLELASSGDGTKIVKVFIKSESGIWSV